MNGPSTSTFLEVTKDFVSSKIPRNGSTKSLAYSILVGGGGTALLARMLYHRHLAKNKINK